MSDTPEVMDEDMLMHRIKAHIASPDVYDPPTFKEMADRIKELEAQVGGLLRCVTDNHEAHCRSEELEAQLEKATKALTQIADWRTVDEIIKDDVEDGWYDDELDALNNIQKHWFKYAYGCMISVARNALAELKGATP
jgi:hypothetical protein